MRPTPARRLPLLLPVIALAFGLAGCDDRSDAKFFDASTPVRPDATEQEIATEIAQLAKGKDTKDDAGSAAHDEAVSKLTARGSAGEPRIDDALRANPDWNVRLGCIEILQSIGGKASVPTLILALADDQPLVAFQANHTLEALTKHQEIPATGKPSGANGLPPVPARAETDLAMDAELRVWTEWHRAHRHELHDAWEAWWKENGKATRVE
jgi:hypothetical protein